jgi:hypothetical protein
MLCMPTFEIGDPMLLFVLVEAGDFLIHAMEAFRSVSDSS